MKKQGFTLIELLIVIVIIGLLAAVVIAAINPVEARNRAVDTGLKSDAGQVYNAIERHYATRGFFPWQANAADATNLGTGGTVVSGAAWLTGALVTTQEIKPEFTGRPSLTDIRVYQSANSVSVCFTPVSQAFLALRNGNDSGVRVAVGTGTQVCLPE